MEAILLIGIQATGKSTFYIERFFNSHVRISLDLLNTRNKESKIIEWCISNHQPFVIDNTNPKKTDRQKYIELAKSSKYKIIGYYFKAKISDVLERNEKRADKAKIPKPGIFGTLKKLEIPSLEEGFDELFFVEIIDNRFVVKNIQELKE